MRFFLRMRETSEGTSYQMVRLVFRHFAADERFARRYRNETSPEIPLTLPFSGIFRGFFRVWLLLKPLSRSRSVAGVHVCVRVCGCECVCCVWKNTDNQRKQREMRVVWCVCGVWYCEVRKYTKTRETLGKFTNRGLHLWHGMAIQGPKKGPKTAIFTDALFLRFLWDLPTIFAGGPNPNAQKRRFSPEVLFQRS